MKKYRPSNGTEGIGFQEGFCFRCKKDKNSDCDILSRSYLYDIDDEDYPDEWTYKDGKPICTAFKDENEPDIEPRCKDTIEMFPELIKEAHGKDSADKE
jgi:hypothetical protein